MVDHFDSFYFDSVYGGEEKKQGQKVKWNSSPIFVAYYCGLFFFILIAGYVHEVEMSTDSVV